MKIVRRNDGWWIAEVPECKDCGPYDTKAEAQDDKRGLEAFFKHGHKRPFVTAEKQ